MKKQYVIAAMVWLIALLAFMVVRDLSQPRGFRLNLAVGLDEGVTIFGVLVLIIVALLALALSLNRTKTQKAFTTVRIALVITVIYTIMAMLSIGMFIIPAVVLMLIAVSGEKEGDLPPENRKT